MLAQSPLAGGHVIDLNGLDRRLLPVLEHQNWSTLLRNTDKSHEILIAAKEERAGEAL
jgi:hypothetical protein